MSQYQPMYNSFQRDPRDRYVPSSRISVSASVRLPSSDLDLRTGELKPDGVRRHRTQAQRLEKQELEQKEKKLKESLEREMKKGGVRVTLNAATCICTVLALVCFFSYLGHKSQLDAYQMRLNEVQAQIQSCNQKMEDLEVAIAETSDPSVICYAASQNLHMIPAASAKAVHLTAVDTRPLETARQTVVAVEETVLIVAQTTQIPAIASAGY